MPEINGQVTLAVKCHEQGVIVSISDTGPGIAKADLPHLFDRFWRKDKSRSRSSGGTGLGLAIARQLIEAQGGQVSAKNLPEGGLQVMFELKK